MFENIKNKFFLINLLILFFISQSVVASNLSQFFPSSSGNLTGAAAAIVCNSSTYNQIRINNTTHQMEYCSPTGDTWRTVQVNPVASVQFSFTGLTNVNPSTLSTSSTVSTVGSGTGAITVTGDGSPQISVAGGAWTTSTAITAGQTLAVRLTSSATLGVTNTATISVGGVSTNWTVGTTPCATGSTTVNYSGAIVNFTQPAGCTTLVIETWGAQGGGAAAAGGLGAYIRGTISTTPGTVYKVLAGGQGVASTNSGGGGGGTFVTTTANAPIMIAGGGGGAYTSTPGSVGVTTNNGGTATGAGGTGGLGGSAGASGANGGAGLTGNGGASTLPSYQVPLSFTNGGTAGPNSAAAAGAGGFGGGSGGEWTQCGSGGSGGGYSGGGGACSLPGAGGGSYNSGTSQTNTAGNNSGNGRVTFTYLP